MAKYRYIDGKPVNYNWYNLLSAARAAGVHFVINSGHRTMKEQWALWRLYKSGKGNLAAFPTPTAPHIKRNHAVDFGVDHGDREAVIAYAAKHGVVLTRTVPGEDWHLEALNGFGRFRFVSKETKLRRELRRLRLRAKKAGGWSTLPVKQRRANSIKKWFKNLRKKK